MGKHNGFELDSDEQLETQEIPRAEKFRMGALLAAGSKGRLFLGGGRETSWLRPSKKKKNSGQTDGRKNVRLSVRQKKKKISGQTDGRKNVCLSVRQKKKKIPDRRTFFCPSVCPSKKKKKIRTDRRTFFRPSVCPSKKKKKFPDRQTDIFSSVCLSGMFLFFFDGQTDGHFFVRLSVRKFIYFFDGQTDGRKNVRLSRNFFFIITNCSCVLIQRPPPSQAAFEDWLNHSSTIRLSRFWGTFRCLRQTHPFMFE